MSAGNMKSIRDHILETRADQPADIVEGRIYHILQMAAPDGESWIELGIDPENLQVLPNGRHQFDLFRAAVRDPERAAAVLAGYAVGDRVRAAGRTWHWIHTNFGWVNLFEVESLEVRNNG